MQMLDNFLILALIAVSFFIGKKISDNYNEQTIRELQYQLRLTSVRDGIGYIAPPAKKQHVPIGQPFMDKLKQNGRAVQQIERQ